MLPDATNPPADYLLQAGCKMGATQLVYAKVVEYVTAGSAFALVLVVIALGMIVAYKTWSDNKNDD